DDGASGARGAAPLDGRGRARGTARGVRRARRAARRAGCGDARGAAGPGPGGRGVSVPRRLADLTPPLAAGLVRLLGPTLRLRADGLEALTSSRLAAGPLVYCVWPGRILLVPWLHT